MKTKTAWSVLGAKEVDSELDMGYTTGLVHSVQLVRRNLSMRKSIGAEK